MPALGREYFLAAYARVDSEELLQLLATRDLDEDARSALLEVLDTRGLHGHALELQFNAAVKQLYRRSGITNTCDYCGRSALFAPVADAGQKFCSSACLREARLLECAVDLAPDLIEEHARAMRLRPCPLCKSNHGLLEMRPAWYTVSAIWIHHTRSDFTLCCRRCAKRINLTAAISCLFLGWWSVSGLFSTPFHIYRNLRNVLTGDPDGDISPQLVGEARLELAEMLAAAKLPA